MGVIDSPVWTIAALMDDLAAYPEWNGNCLHAEVVVPRKDNVMIQYFINSGIVITIDINSIVDNKLKPVTKFHSDYDYSEREARLIAETIGNFLT